MIKDFLVQYVGLSLKVIVEGQYLGVLFSMVYSLWFLSSAISNLFLVQKKKYCFEKETYNCNHDKFCNSIYKNEI